MIPMNYLIFGKGSDVVLSTSTNNTLIGSTLTGSNKYNSNILAPNGKIYCIPDTATRVLEIDPSTGTTTLIGSTYSVLVPTNEMGNKWSGGILAPNGKIYCIPLNWGQVMVIDPIAQTTTLIGTDYIQWAGGTFTAGFGKWHGGALADNGKIYGIPRGHTQMLEIDTTTDTTALVGDVFPLHGEKYSYGCFVNGKIYGMPNTKTDIIVFDIATLTTSYITTTLTTLAYKFSGCCVAQNNKIYAAPNQQSKVLEINTTLGTYTLINAVSGYGSMTLGKNGKPYSVPFSNIKILEIDTVLATSTQVGSNIPTSTHYGSTIGTNGKIYTSPYSATRVLEIEILDTDVLGTDRQIPTDLSTLATSNYNKYYNNR